MVLDNQMRLAQAVACNCPAVIKCVQPLPNHRWPAEMGVGRKDSPSITWFDGFNVFATESDATAKQFDDDRLRRTQVECPDYPSTNVDDDASEHSKRRAEDDAKTFMSKRAWP
jgi:hypothetical protein